MTRKTSRRFTNFSKQNGDQQSNEPEQSMDWQQPQHQDSNDSMPKDNDSLIADMAQGFIQAQAAMTDKTVSVNNLEIALLLQKVNDQLAEIKQSTNNSTQIGGKSSNDTGQDSRQQNGAGPPAQDSSVQTADDGSAKELQKLLAAILQGGNNNNNRENTQNINENKSAEGKNTQGMMTAQNVSQVLAQTQYELANELETSLKKLKQVIEESEKVANNISILLGQENIKNS